MGHNPPKISFEFFPPKSLQASFDLWESLNVLEPLNPEFVSVTFGAGGTTRQLTKDMTEAIGKSYGLDVAAHLTCVNASKAETLAISQNLVAQCPRQPMQRISCKSHPPVCVYSSCNPFAQ